MQTTGAEPKTELPLKAAEGGCVSPVVTLPCESKLAECTPGGVHELRELDRVSSQERTPSINASTKEQGEVVLKPRALAERAGAVSSEAQKAICEPSAEVCTGNAVPARALEQATAPSLPAPTQEAAVKSKGYFTLSDLKASGWTDRLIDQNLGRADRTEPNPRYRWAGAPMRLYSRSRVEAVAERADVKEQLAQVAANRARRRESAKKAVETKVSRAKDAMRSQIIGELPDIVGRYTAKTLVAAACASYNRGDGVPDWVYERGDWDSRLNRASPNSDPAFLRRICCNYVRHQLLDYDRCLGGYTGTKQARAIAHKLVKDAVRRIFKKTMPASVSTPGQPPSNDIAH